MKRSLGIMVMLLIIMVAGTAAYAGDDALAKTSQVVDRTNTLIEGIVEVADETADRVKEVAPEDAYERFLDNLISAVVRVTNTLAEQTVDYAAHNGVEVVCELEGMEIGDRTVLIDPLIIIGFQ